MHLKFNGGHPVILDDNDIIIREATVSEVYLSLTSTAQAYYYNNANEKVKQIIDDLLNQSRV